VNRTFLTNISLLLLILSAIASVEAEDFEFPVSDEFSINITQITANDADVQNKLIIWLPSERGVSKASLPVAESLAGPDTQVWLVDLHGSYMIPTGRNSINNFPVRDFIKLFAYAKLKGYKEIYLLSASRGARLVLDSIYLFSRENPDSNVIKGSILFHPNLYTGTPTMGRKAEFLASAGTSHLPIYLVLAEYSTKYAYKQEIRKQLESGGSRVFMHLLKNVEAGFIARPEDQLSGDSLLARRNMPLFMKRAMSLLSQQPAGRLFSEPRKIMPENNSTGSELALSVYHSEAEPPLLSLPDLYGKNVKLDDYRGNVVLLNFWASWCSPCAKEIPSLMRLKSKLASSPFKIVTVNIGESRERVSNFLEEVGADFPVLLDLEGKATRDWRVYAFPSNFLIDQQGEIRYANHGALEWDSEDIVKTIKSLL